MNKIKLNNGDEYDVDYCGTYENIVSFEFTEPVEIQDMAPIFSDPEKTKKITYLLYNFLVPDQPTVAAVYEGFTRLIAMIVDRWSGRLTIQLIKEA